MRTAEVAGLRLRGDYGVGLMPITTAQLLEVACDSGAVVEVVPLDGRVREVYAEGTIAVRRGMPEPWTRWLLAHGLGHHMLHPRANHLYLAGAAALFEVDKHENEAELFAGALLIGQPHRAAAETNDALEMAAWADVPFACALRWLRLRAIGAPKRVVPTLGRLSALIHAPAAGMAALLFLGVGLRLHDLDQNGLVDIVRGIGRGLGHGV